MYLSHEGSSLNDDRIIKDNITAMPPEDESIFITFHRPRKLHDLYRTRIVERGRPSVRTSEKTAYGKVERLSKIRSCVSNGHQAGALNFWRPLRPYFDSADNSPILGECKFLYEEIPACNELFRYTSSFVMFIPHRDLLAISQITINDNLNELYMGLVWISRPSSVGSNHM